MRISNLRNSAGSIFNIFSIAFKNETTQNIKTDFYIKL